LGKISETADFFDSHCRPVSCSQHGNSLASIRLLTALHWWRHHWTALVQ